MNAIYEAKDTLDIYGTGGSIHVPVLNNGIMTITTNKGTRQETVPCSPNMHLLHIKAFTDAVLQGEPIPVPGETGREVSSIIDVIYR